MPSSTLFQKRAQSDVQTSTLGSSRTDGIGSRLYGYPSRVDASTVTGGDFTVVSVAIRSASATLTIARPTVQLTADVLTANGEKLGDEPEWASDDEDVATVDATGLVTSTGLGTCAITASVGAVDSPSCAITVTSLTTETDVLQTSMVLTNAQIKALPTTPVQIVAAPGAGKMIVLEWGVFSCDTTAGDYSHFNNSATVNPSPFSSSVYFALDAADNFNDASGPVVAGRSDASGGILTGTRRSVAIVNGVSGGLMGVGPDASFDQGEAGGASLGYENADLSIVGQNDNLGNFQGGHADNTMTVTVRYAVVDV